MLVLIFCRLSTIGRYVKKCADFFDAKVGLKICKVFVVRGINFKKHKFCSFDNSINLIGYLCYNTHMQNQGEQYLKEILHNITIEGYEQSIKLSNGKILTDRWLFGIIPDKLTSNKLNSIFDNINMPTEYQNDFFANISNANQILFGYEHDDTGIIIKAYLEFWDQVCQTVIANEPAYKQSGTKPGPQLMHKGYKWLPDNPKKCNITSYYCLPLLTPREISRKIPAIYPDNNPTPSQTAALGFLNLTASKSPHTPIIYLEAGEQGNPRKSFDLNLYKADLSVETFSKILDTLIANYNIPESQWLNSFAPIRHHTLGHISAGTNRNGNDFFTAYFEIE